jgi:hypothetical protein
MSAIRYLSGSHLKTDFSTINSQEEEGGVSHHLQIEKLQEFFRGSAISSS